MADVFRDIRFALDSMMPDLGPAFREDVDFSVLNERTCEHCGCTLCPRDEVPCGALACLRHEEPE
jgi:hypothetical protein